MGKWSEKRIYKAGDIVQWDGTSWWTLRTTTPLDEPGKSDAFGIVITKPRNGRDGKDGASGRDGKDGRNGSDGAQGAPGRSAPAILEIQLHEDGLNFVLDNGDIKVAAYKGMELLFHKFGSQRFKALEAHVADLIDWRNTNGR